jgi:hypothetical protein
MIDCSKIMQTKSCKVICFNFDITNQLVILCYYLSNIVEKKIGMYWGVRHPFIDLRKACDGIRRELLYDILSESGVPMQLFVFFKCN